MSVDKGDILLIPSIVGDTNRIHVQWQQSLRDRSGDYYNLEARNKSQGDAKVVFFVQTDWFNDQHLGAKGAHGFYEVKIDERFQYGQISQNNKRWVVLHDKERKPYQYRFVKPLLEKVAQSGGKAAELIGFPAHDLEKIISQLQKLFGDYLHTF
ncbi:hypothetical protein BOTBODRAFT_116919 [Botryobasidium botryosum FD-172 SS1]|uniref:Uncharacterized protein n=1 Tax=Botryobasidium botryosum (strain FD-172 SS1) TaxID=930990 RepID=A0A067M263_BOTB1|nr:hypothetical protein BOTBODRAFT_116919 [Botryobasidium botryosum FD-172 SS1]